MTSPKIIAVVVTYYPKWSKLHTLLQALLPQIDSIIVIDNGSDAASVNNIRQFTKDHAVKLYCLGQNRGIASAQNKGIALAKGYGGDYVVLFDQDSIPAPHMVLRLLDASRAQEAQGIKVGAVGPFYRDPRRPVTSRPFVRLKGFGLVRTGNRSSENIVPVSYLIASGSLISIATLDVVGPMREELFVDYVDIDWGLRARQLGFRSFGVSDALLDHHLGDQIRFILGKNFCFHSPLRHYYQFRNGIWLNRNSCQSWDEKIGGGLRLLKRFIAIMLFAKPHTKNLSMMLQGILHGITGKLGKYPDKKNY